MSQRLNFEGIEVNCQPKPEGLAATTFRLWNEGSVRGHNDCRSFAGSKTHFGIVEPERCFVWRNLGENRSSDSAIEPTNFLRSVAGYVEGSKLGVVSSKLVSQKEPLAVIAPIRGSATLNPANILFFRAFNVPYVECSSSLRRLAAYAHELPSLVW
jgi:hypothetical protein